MNEKVVIGMSGGVDSSVAAYILKEQGYEVIGLTMRLWDAPKLKERDATLAERDARKICDALGIEHHIVDLRKEFTKYVVDYFVDEYKNGRTPNPCIACNKFLKFDEMYKVAETFGAGFIATGHYARIEQDAKNGRYTIKKAKFDAKDQTYVLYSLTQEQLSRTLMPLGYVESKTRVREIAESLGLISADKKDSMEICFIPDNDYVGFIEKYAKIKLVPGDFVDADGNILGRHKGIINYTVGQRKGLGVTFGKPMFVTKIDAENNTVVLGEKGTEFSSGLIADRINFVSIDLPKEPISVLAKVRYSAKPSPARVTVNQDGSAAVDFDLPQRAITPGQAVVFYDNDGENLIGGGIIRDSAE